MWNKAETRAVSAGLSSPFAADSNSWTRAGNICSACSGVRKLKQQQQLLRFTLCRLSWMKHPRNDAKHSACSTGRWDTIEDASVLNSTCLQRFNSSRNTHVEQTGMNQMKLSSEELRSLPPRPPTLPAASPKRRFVKLGRKTSDGSQQWVWTTGQQTQLWHVVQINSKRVMSYVFAFHLDRVC